MKKSGCIIRVEQKGDRQNLRTAGMEIKDVTTKFRRPHDEKTTIVFVDRLYPYSRDPDSDLADQS